MSEMRISVLGRGLRTFRLQTDFIVVGRCGSKDYLLASYTNLT